MPKIILSLFLLRRFSKSRGHHRLSINLGWFLRRTSLKEYETECEQINGSQLALIENVNSGNSVFDEFHSMHNHLTRQSCDHFRWNSSLSKHIITTHVWSLTRWSPIHSHCEENLFHKSPWYSSYKQASVQLGVGFTQMTFPWNIQKLKTPQWTITHCIHTICSRNY